jgi:hypothetical protein
MCSRQMFAGLEKRCLIDLGACYACSEPHSEYVGTAEMQWTEVEKSRLVWHANRASHIYTRLSSTSIKMSRAPTHHMSSHVHLHRKTLSFLLQSFIRRNQIRYYWSFCHSVQKLPGSQHSRARSIFLFAAPVDLRARSLGVSLSFINKISLEIHENYALIALNFMIVCLW